MGKTLYKRLLYLLLAAPLMLITWLPSAFSAPDSVTIKIAIGAEANRTTPEAASSVMNLIEARIKQQVDGIYSDPSKDLLLLPKPGSDPVSGNVELEKTYGRISTTCSLNGHRFQTSSAKAEPKPEVTSNHRNKSCGSSFDTIECEENLPQQGDIRAQLVTGTGTKEKAYLNGVFFEALDCVSRELKEEISSAQELKLLGNGTNNPCQSFVNDYENARIKLQQDNEKLSAESRVLCQYSKEGLPEQAGCYAKAGIASLDSLFATVATCEAFRRANQAFSNFSARYFSPRARQKHWKKLAKGCASEKTCRAFKLCYENEFQDLIKTESKKAFPKDSSEGKCVLQ